MISPEIIYNEHLTKYNATLKKIIRTLGIISVLRFVSFILTCFLVYTAFGKPGDVIILGSALALIIFIISVRLAFRFQDRKKLTEKLIYVTGNELKILGGGLNLFDNGVKFLNPDNYTGDLDIFGSGSLYGLLNRTTTSHGSELLSSALQQPLLTEELISRYQQAVKTMSAQTERRLLITAHGLLNEEKEGTLGDIRAWLREQNKLAPMKWLQVARFAVPVFNVWAFYYYLDTDKLGPVLIGLAVASSIVIAFSGYIASQHKLLTKKQAILDQYAGILRIFGKTEAGDVQLLSELKTEALYADRGIHQLAKLSSLFDQRLNLVVIVLLNGFLLYDIQCMLKLEQWKTKYKNKFDKWVEIVGKIELLNSLGGFAFNNPGYTYPLVHNFLEIHTSEMAHPLIQAKLNVANSLKTGREEQLIILTGSNMSGKTTFLRTLGVNLVLAQCGAPVNAARFVFRPMMILSSIRVGDSLQENTSYFMAELKKLRKIIDSLETGEPALVLIDEILRGTNSDDKTFGSAQFIRKLIDYKCLSLFATHDLSLSVLENELTGRVKNYCFESVIKDGELIFDYTLQQGVASNKNASFLMKKMGII
jgi:ABC-type branched-subunit amino acid transport system ATPase component